MTTKEWLSQAFTLNNRIRSIEEQIEAIRTAAEKATPSLTGLPKATTTRSSMEIQAVRIADMEIGLRRDYYRLTALKAEIYRAINQVDDPQARLVLELRYLLFLRWYEIANRMNYSTRAVFKLHRKALTLVAKYVPDDEGVH